MPTVFRFATYGWIGVEIFFVISGFVICMSCWGRTPRQFFVSRVIRLYPAYWFAIAFTTAVLVALPGVWEPAEAREVLSTSRCSSRAPASANVDGVYWTLWSELRFYLLFMVVVATGLTYRKVVVFCCVWGAAAMFAPCRKFHAADAGGNPDGAWYFIAGLALYLMHRFGQDLLLWGILAPVVADGPAGDGDRIDTIERVSSWRGSVLIFTVFLLSWSPSPSAAPTASAGSGWSPRVYDLPVLSDALRRRYDDHQPAPRHHGPPAPDRVP